MDIGKKYRTIRQRKNDRTIWRKILLTATVLIGFIFVYEIYLK